MSQIASLFKKNWLIYKRNKLGSVLQILIPIKFLLFTILTRYLAQIDTYSQQSNLSNFSLVFNFYGDPIVAISTLSVPNPTYLKPCGGKIVALVPTGDPMVTKLKTILQAAGYQTTEYSSDEQIDSIVRNNEYGTTYPYFCFGVSFETTGKTYKYNLRFNISNWQELPSPDLKLTLDLPSDISYFYKPFGSGALGLTTIINSLILQTQLSSTTTMLVNKQGIIYQEEFSYDSLYLYLGGSFQFINLLPLLIVYLRQTSFMLEEKEKKIRQNLLISGMKLRNYYFTWFFRYFCIYAIVHAVNTYVLIYCLPRIPWYMPLTLYLLFDILLLIQSFFIQIFVTRSKTGIILALVFFILQYSASYAISSNTNVTQQIYNLIAIIPHVSYVLAFKNLFYADSMGITPTFQTLLDKFQIKVSVISLAINICVWAVLFWYFEQVIPNQWGAKKGICFFLQAPKTNKTNQLQNKSNQITNIKIQNQQPIQQQQDLKHKIQQQQNKTIKIENLNKMYDQLHAVKDLNLNLYSDQIFVLLGHNGAGKTSFISMLTGMTQPTSGYIQVLGMTDLEEWRQKLGVCPQHDTLYDELTVEQHVKMFAALRGLSDQLFDNQVSSLINAVNLQQKRHQYAKNLSGGQKRRLSVALAFSGGSKVIILDEPTSGMDTSARRHIWQMLKKFKNGRIIILTTHFMDEADYLGDRIGIMSSGRLMAIGSPLYLKTRFGVGYNLTLVKNSSSVKSEPIIHTIQKYVEDVNIITNVSSQISAQLPLTHVKHFSKLFSQLDTHKKQLGLETYGVSITTLEQVFLKISDQEQIKQKQIQQKQKIKKQKIVSKIYDQQGIQQMNLQSQSRINISGKHIKNQNMETSIIVSRSTMLKKQMDILNSQDKWEREDQCCQRFVSHFGATVLKRLRVVRRDAKSFIFQLVLPMAIFVIAMFLMRISFVRDSASMDLSYNLYLSETNPITVPIGSDSSNSALLSSLANKMTQVYGSTLDIRQYNSSSDLIFDKQYLLPLKKQNYKLRGGIYFSATSTTSGITIVPFTSIMNTRSPTSSITVQTLAAQAQINNILPNNVYIKPVSKPFPMTQKQLQINNTISGFFGALIFSIALSFKFASIVSFIVKQRQDNCKHQQIVSGLHLGAYWFGNYAYDFGLYAIIAAFSLGMCWVFDIKVLIQGSFLATCFLFGMFGFCNITLTYLIAFLFQDYGNAQGVVYFFNFVAGGIAPIIVLVLRWIDQYSNTTGRAIAWALRLIPAFSFGQGLINISSMSILTTYQNNGNEYSAMDLQIALAPIIYLSILGLIFILLMLLIEHIKTSQQLMRKFSFQNQFQETQSIQQEDVLAEQKKALAANPEQYQILTKKLRKVYVLDSDKKYKLAVDNLSFGVQKGEVFGLLGVNGAGKSTTFKMLAGQIVSTSGDCYFTGLKISQNLPLIRKNLGYCPQFDALIQNLTVKEQLQLYYDMKCLPKRFKKFAIQQIINELDLTIHQDKLSGTLSGGNKRKLSVGLAIIGNPSIVFLDQPSTGMDPKARRFMWKVISKIATQRKQSSVILTTHSMQEAQALSTRIAIMVKGNFKCIGTPQHIKSKYGKGFEIQIKIKPISLPQIQAWRKSCNLQNSEVDSNNFQRVIQFLKFNQTFSNLINKKGKGQYILHEIQSGGKVSMNALIEFLLLQQRFQSLYRSLTKNLGPLEEIQNFGTYIRYKTKQSSSISKLFEYLESSKSQLFVNQYSLKQASVEQIFNKFAQGNDDEIEEN